MEEGKVNLFRFWRQTSPDDKILVGVLFAVVENRCTYLILTRSNFMKPEVIIREIIGKAGGVGADCEFYELLTSLRYTWIRPGRYEYFRRFVNTDGDEITVSGKRNEDSLRLECYRIFSTLNYCLDYFGFDSCLKIYPDKQRKQKKPEFVFHFPS